MGRIAEHFHRFMENMAVLVLQLIPASPRVKTGLVWLVAPRRTLVAAAIINDDRGGILVLRSSYLDAWQLPGGLVGFGEKCEHAVRREVREELGLEVGTVELRTIRRRGDGREILVVYGVTLAPGAIRLSIEHTAWRYAPRNELPPSLRSLVTRSNPGSGIDIDL